MGDYTYIRTGETVEIDGKKLIVPEVANEIWQKYREALSWRRIKLGFFSRNFPVMTTDKIPEGLHPIWTVSADSEWNMDLHSALRSLADNLRMAAPSYTAALYNLKWKWTDYHGHEYLQGTADAYTRSNPQSVEHFARQYVGLE